MGLLPVVLQDLAILNSGLPVHQAHLDSLKDTVPLGLAVAQQDDTDLGILIPFQRLSGGGDGDVRDCRDVPGVLLVRLPDLFNHVDFDLSLVAAGSHFDDDNNSE